MELYIYCGCSVAEASTSASFERNSVLQASTLKGMVRSEMNWNRMRTFILSPLCIAASIILTFQGVGTCQSAPENPEIKLKIRAENLVIPGEKGYLLGEEDEITIRATDAEELGDKPVRIDGSGYLRLPMIGRVRAAGRTIPELEEDIAALLQPYVKKPVVTIRLTEGKSHPISVVGAIKNPGVYQIAGPKTLVEALALGGSLGDDSGYRVRVTRDLRYGPLPLVDAKPDPTGKFSLGEVPIEELMGGLNPALNFQVRPHDVITVPRADTIYVLGEVNKPGGFTLRERESLSVLQAVSLAQGTTRVAHLKMVRILRAETKGGPRVTIPVNLSAVLAGREEDMRVRSDDILFVPNNTMKTISTRMIETAIQVGTGILIWRR